MNVSRETIHHTADLCVIGGGLAGMCAAIAAARKGTKVVLMQDRPVLGGNASSEIRMWVRGAHGEDNRETGIVNELNLDNIFYNPTLNFSKWDAVLYGKVRAEKNIELLLNTTCLGAEMDQDTIQSVTGWQLTTYTWHTVTARLFADCSGDSILSEFTGALSTKGREPREQYDESIEPDEGDAKTMGMTCLLQARQTDHFVSYTPPDWAKVFLSDEDLKHRGHDLTDCGTNFWWMELGGEDDSVRDTERLRDELLAIAFGVWDHIKNRGDHGADHWELEWVGFLPGKRESRRYLGDHVLCQKEVEAGGRFPDVAAYGGWTMDDHNPAGFRHPGEPTIYHPAPSPFGIPYRCFYSKNIRNLFFAGRNISVSHAALSSTRVMATCAVTGQAVGNAAAICVKKQVLPRGVYEHYLSLLQQELLDDGCYLPGLVRAIPEETLRAGCSLLESQRSVLQNGIERPLQGKTNAVPFSPGQDIAFSFEPPFAASSVLRIVFDPDFSGKSISNDPQLRRYANRCNVFLPEHTVTMPAPLAKSFSIYGRREDGTEQCLYSTMKNHAHVFLLRIDQPLASIRVRLESSWGGGDIPVFSCDVRFAAAADGSLKANA